MGTEATQRAAGWWQLPDVRTLVVGGYGGLGEVLSGMFADSGAQVAVAGRRADAAEELAQRLAKDGARTMGVGCDVTDRASVRGAVAAVVDEWGGLDVVVNCASRLVVIPAEAMTDDAWHEVMETNLTGAFLVSQEAARSMIDSGGGRIIHFSSVRSFAGARRGFSAYGSAKAGVNLLVRQLATEWARHGITVNAVAPGFVRTQFVRDASADPQFMRTVLERIPLGRVAEAEEVAGAALYLASPLARFVTGQVLVVDGGVTASQ